MSGFYLAIPLKHKHNHSDSVNYFPVIVSAPTFTINITICCDKPSFSNHYPVLRCDIKSHFRAFYSIMTTVTVSCMTV